MQRFAVLLMVFGLTVPVLAQDKDAKSNKDLTDPVEICKRADEATKAVKSISYKATFTATVPSAPKVEGTVMMAGKKSQRGPTHWYADAKVQMPDSSEVKRYAAGTTPDLSYAIDFENKIAYADMDPAVMGSLGRNPQLLLMIEYGHPTPFNDEVTGSKHELRESVKIGDEPCYVIYVEYSGGRGKAVWYFSKNDFLPRRVDRLEVQGVKDASTTTTLTDLKLDPKIDENTFKLKVPEGFKKTDDFAP